RGRRGRLDDARERPRADRVGRHGRRLRPRAGTGPARDGAAVHPARRHPRRHQLRRVPAAAARAGLGGAGERARPGPAGLDDHHHRPRRRDPRRAAGAGRPGPRPHRRRGGTMTASPDTESPTTEKRTMRAITIVGEGELELAELPEPTPGPGEVLVDVVAAGVNRADLARAAGKYPPPPGASELPGLEVSGRRRDTGEGVVALLAGGGYAEVVAVPEAQLLPAPEGMGLIDAAGVVEAAATVVSNLVLEAGMREGETVLVHGGTGGIGTVAIQLAKAMDAREIGRASCRERD